MPELRTTPFDDLHLRRDVLPLFRMHRNEGPVASAGTGFLIAPGVLVTCLHCLQAVLGPGEYWAALTPQVTGYQPHELHDVQQARDRTDLALARVELEPHMRWPGREGRGLELSHEPVGLGGDVYTFGYPFVTLEGSSFRIQPRYLKGYVTRVMSSSPSGYAPALAYELDMPAPAGLSGAPLILAATRAVVGVVFGSTDVATIDSFARIDPQTGVRSPEIQRVMSFALAHHTSILWEMRGEATDGRRIAEVARHAV